MSKSRSLILLATTSFSVGGCSLGLTVPEMQEPYVLKVQESLDESQLASQIKCEIREGVRNALNKIPAKGPTGGRSVDWLNDWQAKVSMKLTVDEKAALNPGVTFSTPLRNAVSHFSTNGNVTTQQLFSTAVGLQASSDATRVETIGYTYNFANLLTEQATNCYHASQTLILSDLKIGDFILNKVAIANNPSVLYADDEKPKPEETKTKPAKKQNKQANSLGASPFTTFTYEVTFVVVYGGNVTPTWKLVDITANNNSPLFNATRTRTHDVLITLGKIGSDDAANAHQAQLIGQAVATAIQSQQH